MDIYKKLSGVQEKLKAPKGQYNQFGKYNYRSCEDILTADKPLLKDAGLALTISDTIELIGDRFYIRAAAELRNCENDSEFVSVTAFSREPEEKRGMDASQITGTASSYARKYALNGLFLIDDTKDADTDEHHNQTHNAKITKNQVLAMRICCKKHGMPESKIYEMYNKKSLEDMTVQDFESFQASGKKIVAAWDKENENKGNTE